MGGQECQCSGPGRGIRLVETWVVLVVCVGAVLAEPNSTMSYVDLPRPSEAHMITTVEYDEEVNETSEWEFGELTEFARNFLRCSDRRVVVETDAGGGGSNTSCTRSVAPPWVARGKEVGICGMKYNMKDGDKIKVKFPRKDQRCEIAFHANLGVSLSIKCPKFSLRDCSEEFLLLTDGTSTESIYCNMDGPATQSGFNQLLLVYQRNTRRRMGSKFRCIVKAKDHSGGGGGSTGDGGSTGVGEGSTGVSPDSPAKGQQLPSCATTCGAAPPGAGVERIVGGQQASPGEYPWIALVEIKVGGEDRMCGGSFLSKRFVVTAAHCIDFERPILTVLGGVYNQFILHNGNVQKFGVQKYIQHPNYDNKTQANDIALLTLDADVTWTQSVRPVCLGYRDYEGEMAVVAGWGTLSYHGSQPDGLMEVSVKVVDHTSCASAYQNSVLEVLASNICAADVGKDSCQGDSGGPLVVLEGGVWYLIGTVSYGIGCARAEYPGVYSRISSYVPWILDNISDSC